MQPGEPLVPATILVVDDSDSDRRLVRELLQRNRSWRTIAVASAEEALEQVADRPPDLVLTDLMMPGIGGLQLIAELSRRLPQVPIVAMTGQGSEQLALDALRRGALSYLCKSDLATRLADTVSRVWTVSRSRHRRQNLLRCLRRQRCRFALESDLRLVPPLIAFVQTAVTDIGLSDASDACRIGIALEEAVNNAMFHGNLELSSEVRTLEPPRYQQLVAERQTRFRQRRVHFTAEIDPCQASFVVRDDGPGFRHQSLVTQPPELDQIGGRGVLLMRSFMDDVAYNARGNEVTLRRFRTTAGGTLVAGQGNVEVPTGGPRAATDPPLAGRRLPAEHPDSQEADQ